MRSSTRRRLASPSDSGMRRMPLDSSWPTAPSQPARLKMKVIAGSRPSRSRRSMTSARRRTATGTSAAREAAAAVATIRAHGQPVRRCPGDRARPSRHDRRAPPPPPEPPRAPPLPRGRPLSRPPRELTQCESHAPRPSVPRMAWTRSGLTAHRVAPGRRPRSARRPRRRHAPRRRGRRASGRPSCAATAAPGGAPTR